MASALLLFLFLPPNISCCGYVAGRPWPVESSPSSKHKHHGLRPPRPTSKLIYVRTVLGADLGAVKKYTGMADCLKKTVASNGFMSFYSDIGPSTIGIVVYRGAQFSLQDTLRAFSPYLPEGLHPHRPCLQVRRRPARRVCLWCCLIPVRHHAASSPDRGLQAGRRADVQGHARLLRQGPQE